MKEIIGAIPLLLIFYGIFYLFRRDFRRKKSNDQKHAEQRIQNELHINKLQSSIIDFAVENKRIRTIHFDIEEGGKYHSSFDEGDIQIIKKIIKKHIINVGTCDFYDYSLEKFYVTKIKNEILELPKLGERYLGF